MGPPNDSQIGERNSNFTMVYGTEITIVTGVISCYFNQLITGRGNITGIEMAMSQNPGTRMVP